MALRVVRSMAGNRFSAIQHDPDHERPSPRQVWTGTWFSTGMLAAKGPLWNTRSPSGMGCAASTQTHLTHSGLVVQKVGRVAPHLLNPKMVQRLQGALQRGALSRAALGAGCACSTAGAVRERP